MERIQLLDAVVANQIAAGEVIENPASIVKELVENSLDAGATKITIEIEKAGLQKIKITDNGAGIHKDDLVLALTRHGTSKIKQLDDLNHSLSLGFRGEALASICSIAHISLNSRIKNSDSAWQIAAEGGSLISQVMPSSHLQGTTIEVNDIFFNTPARRKFLRSEKTEFASVEEVVSRLAISHFPIRFELVHNQREIYLLPHARTEIEYERRLHKLLGKAFVAHAVSFSSEVDNIKLWGWLAQPSYHRGRFDHCFTYVNQRMVRDKTINHAIRQAYAEYLPSTRYPVCIVFVNLDPERLDVNVHPAKHEIRFHETRLIHDFIVHTFREVLYKEIQGQKSEQHQQIEQTSFEPRESRIFEFEKQDYFASGFSTVAESSQTSYGYGVKQTTQPALNQSEHAFPLIYPYSCKRLTSIHHRYLLLQSEETLIILSIFRALQQISYTNFYKNFQTAKNLNALPLIMPRSLNAEMAQCEWVEQKEAFLNKFGMMIDRIGENVLFIRALPKNLENVEIMPLLLEMMSILKKENDEQEMEHKILITFAKNSASAKQKSMKDQDYNDLLLDLKEIDGHSESLLPYKIWDTMTSIDFDLIFSEKNQ